MQSIRLESWEMTRIRKLRKYQRIVSWITYALKIVFAPFLIIVAMGEMVDEEIEREIGEIKAEICVQSYLKMFEDDEYDYHA